MADEQTTEATTTETQEESLIAENKTETTTESTTAEEFTPLTADDLTFPEGAEVDESIRDEFLQLSNEAKLSKEAVNALVGLQTKIQQQAAEKLSEAWNTTQTQWRDEAKTLMGEALDPALGKIRQLVDEYGTPNVMEVFNLTGAGNNPHIIQFLSKVAEKLVVEAGPVSGSSATQPQDRAKRIFPDMN